MGNRSLKIKEEDIFGLMYMLHQDGQGEQYSIEREDGLLETGKRVGDFFLPHKRWSQVETFVLRSVQGKILDVGAGTGKHSLYYQGLGHEVWAFDNSPRAIKIMGERGVKNALQGDVNQIEKLILPNDFDTVLLMHNNFGLCGNRQSTLDFLRKVHSITSAGARIISVGVNPYASQDLRHIEYNRRQERNDKKGVVRLRIRYKNIIGPWYLLYMLSPQEMGEMSLEAGWRVMFFNALDRPVYGAVLVKA